MKVLGLQHGVVVVVVSHRRYSLVKDDMTVENDLSMERE